MNGICEISRFLLLRNIEVTLIDAVCHDILAKLSAAELMQYQTLFTGINHGTIIQFFIFLCQLCFLCQLFQNCEHIVIHFLCCKIIIQTAGHRHRVLCNTRGAVLTGHLFYEIYFSFQCEKLIINSQRIKVFPCNHNVISSSVTSIGFAFTLH